MAQKTLLVVDADPRSLGVLTASLRKAGFALAAAGDVEGALARLEQSDIDLVLADTRLPGKSGFDLVLALRKVPEWAALPVVFLSSDTSVDAKVRSLQLGIEDFLAKPLYAREVIARIELALGRAERERLARRGAAGTGSVTGQLSELGLADLFQTIELSRKSGELTLEAGPKRGVIVFRDGQVIDASLGALRGPRALDRLMGWPSAKFALEFRPVGVSPTISLPMASLVVDAIARAEAWAGVRGAVPPLTSVLEIASLEKASRLDRLEPAEREVLSWFDGRATVEAVLDLVADDDVRTLEVVAALLSQGILREKTRGEAPDAGVERKPARPASASDTMVPAPSASFAPETRAGHTIGPGRADPDGARERRVEASARQPEPARTTIGPNARAATPAAAAEPARTTSPGGSGGAQVGTGTGDASGAKNDAGASTKGGKRTLLGFGLDAAAALAAAASAATQRDDSEDPMAKKKGNKQPKRPSLSDDLREAPKRAESVAPPKAESAEPSSNVIQFPAKRGPSDDEAPSAERPLPGELPRVRDEAGAEKRDAAASTANVSAPPPARERPEERRKKKSETTSSEELRALGTGEHAEVSADFFGKKSTPPPAGHDDFSDLDGAVEPLPMASRRWMYGTVGIFLAFAGAIGGYWYYQNVHLPEPIELGASEPVVMPRVGAGGAPVVAAAAAAPTSTRPTTPPSTAPSDGEAPAPEAAPVAEIAPVPEAAPEPEAAVEPAPTPVAAPATEAAPIAAPVPAAAGETYDSVVAEARETRRAAQAIPLWERAIELNPSGSEALAQLSYLLISRGRGDDNERARGYAERATSLDPTSSLGWVVLGAAREAARDRAGAREAYRACVERGAPGRWQAECRAAM